MVFSGNYFYKVDLSVARYEGGAKTTKTFSFVNKALKDSTSVAQYWPILQSVGEITYAAGETLPSLSIGSIEIDNSVGSFGAGRKFSDILQPGYYSPIEQAVVVYVAQVANDSDTVSSWTQIASGVVQDWEAPVADGGGTLTFNVRPFKFDDKVLTLEVNRSVSGMENAPDSSLGRAVPLILGDNQTVLPVRISADGATTAKYAWGTCLYQHLQNDSGSYVVYTKNYDDDWELCNDTEVFYDYGADTSDGTMTLNTYDAFSVRTNQNGAGIVTGVTLYAQGNGTGGRVSTATLDVFVLRVDVATLAVVEDPMVKGSVELSNYDTQNNAGTAEFEIKVSFDRPFFASTTGSFYEYYLGFRVRNYAVNELSLHYSTNARSQLIQDSTFDSDTARGGWHFTIGDVLMHTFHTVTYSVTDHVSAYTQSGLTYSLLTLSQVAPDTGQSNPDFDNLPIAFQTEQGLVLYPGSGATVSRPTTVTDMLSYVWNTSTNAWEDPNTWDITTLDSSHYAYLYDGASANHRTRAASGVFDSKVTFAQVASEVCRGTASRVGILSTGKAFMYPWGVTVTPAFDIPFADVQALTWQQRDVSTVVNRCVINLGRNYILPPKAFENADDAKSGFLYSTDFSAANFAQVRAMTAESRALYGNRDLANTNFPIYPFTASGGYYLGLTSDDQGSVLADYYLSRFAKPLVYASFVVPWHRYSTLKMFDVITFSTPAFPAYHGTDPDPRQGWVVDAGGTVTTVDVNSGYDLVQAQTYRGLVEGLTYVMAMEHAPALKLTVLVLQNYAVDPT